MACELGHPKNESPPTGSLVRFTENSYPETIGKFGINVGDLVIAMIDFHLGVREEIFVCLIEKDSVMLVIEKRSKSNADVVAMTFLKDGRKLTSEGGIANWDRFIKVLND